MGNPQMLWSCLFYKAQSTYRIIFNPYIILKQTSLSSDNLPGVVFYVGAD